MNSSFNLKKILKSASQKIKNARVRQNITIKELARITGLSIYKVKKIETGEYNFKLKEFDKITKQLGFELTVKKRL